MKWQDSDDQSIGRVLRESDAARLLADALPVCIAYVDSDLIYRFNNRTYEKWFDIEPATIAGQSVKDILGEVAFEANRERMEQALAGESVRYETEVRYRDGSTRHVRASFIPDVRETGEVKGFFSVVDDVTEAKRPDRRIRKLLLESAPDAMILVDRNAEISLANRHAERLFGYGRGELLGRPIGQLIPERVRAQHVEHRKAYFAAPTVRSMGAGEELFGVRKDGAEFPAEISLSPVRIDGGPAVVAAIRDVTARKEAETRLRQSEARSSALVRAIPDLLFRFSREGVFLDFEPGKAVDPYRPPEEFLRRRVDDVLPANVARYVMSGIERALRTGETQVLEYELAVNGETRYYESRLAVCERNEIIAIVRDVTDRVRAQQEKEEAETQLRQANKMDAIGSLAGGIAHDFNNILTAIIGFTSLAEETLPQGSPQKEHLKSALEASERARDLVRQILDFSHMGDRRSVVVDMTRVVRDALRLLRATIPSSIEIRQVIAEDSGRVLADSTQIQQIIINLCTNAYQAIETPPGLIEVSLKAVTVDTQISGTTMDLPEGSYVELTVADNGGGIDPAICARIFDPFFTTKEIGEGTGLGLSVVHGLVRKQGGAITVQSERGKGARFAVYFPRIEGVEEEANQAAEAPSRGSEHILFVDDEETIVLVAGAMLEAGGYQVTGRTGGVEALEVFRARPEQFDAAVLDVTMPNMTGVELAAKLMSIRPDLPVILTTGFTELITAREAKRKGIRGIIMKPFAARDLGAKIRKLLDGE